MLVILIYDQRIDFNLHRLMDRISYIKMGFFCTCYMASGLLVPNQGLNLCPLHLKWGFLTNGLPGKSPENDIICMTYIKI